MPRYLSDRGAYLVTGPGTEPEVVFARGVVPYDELPRTGLLEHMALVEFITGINDLRTNRGIQPPESWGETSARVVRRGEIDADGKVTDRNPFFFAIFEGRKCSADQILGYAAVDGMHIGEIAFAADITEKPTYKGHMATLIKVVMDSAAVRNADPDVSVTMARTALGGDVSIKRRTPSEAGQRVLAELGFTYEQPKIRFSARPAVAHAAVNAHVRLYSRALEG